MKYLQLGIFVLFIIIPMLAVWRYIICLRRDFIGRILTESILKKQSGSRKKFFYSSQTVQKTAEFLAGQNKNQTRESIKALCKTDFAPLRRQLQEKNMNGLAADFSAMLTGRAHASMSENAQIWFLLQKGNYDRAEKLLYRKKGCSDLYEKALQAYCNGCLQLREGDMLSASENFTRAAFFFRKSGYAFEEGQSYLMNGTVYRVCGMEDLSRLMLITARRIFATKKMPLAEAEILGNLGMLMTMRKHFDEAESYFDEASRLFLQNKHERGYAEIINQKALNLIIQGQNKPAGRKARQALGIHRKMRNPAGEAFSLELLAHNAAASGDWKGTIRYSRAAEKIYKQLKNTSARREALLLNARAEFENENFEKSEKILRQIINDSQKYPSCFHVANAYHLLGMIYLKQGDLRRARGLFQQSLDCELQNERTDGAAVDYANIALIDYQRGQKKQSAKTFATALDYAKAFEEGEVYKLLKKSRALH